MRFLFLVFLIGFVSAEQASDEIKEKIKEFLKSSNGGPIDANGHELKLLDKCIGQTEYVVVWKALFDGNEVAVKISLEDDFMEQEIEIYRSLKAFSNPMIEKLGIPRAYYSGKIFEKYPALVITLFDESVENRHIKQDYSFNAYSTLQVFLQSVKALKYMHRKSIIHQDIKPQNMFLRGNRVFIGDFDISTKKGQFTEDGTRFYASARFFKNVTREPMDDLESLVYTLWEIENLGSLSPYSGYKIMEQTHEENVALMTDLCKHFSNFPRSQEACQFIFIDQVLSDKLKVPQYNRIIHKLETALGEVKKTTGQTEFEWIKSPPSEAKQLKFGEK